MKLYRYGGYQCELVDGAFDLQLTPRETCRARGTTGLFPSSCLSLWRRLVAFQRHIGRVLVTSKVAGAHASNFDGARPDSRDCSSFGLDSLKFVEDRSPISPAEESAYYPVKTT